MAESLLQTSKFESIEPLEYSNNTKGASIRRSFSFFGGVLGFCMLHRGDSDGLITISQPAHAWLSGELARYWGNEPFGDFAPKEEMCLAAALHDIGFLDWEQNPTLDPETGFPYSFYNLPTPLHLEIWSRGIQQMMRFGRYPALMVSLHYTHLNRQHPPRSPEQTRNFVREQEAFQRTLVTSLRNDAFYEPFSTDDVITRNRQLVSLWDYMSLLLCLGFDEERVIEGAPMADGPGAIRLVPLRKDCFAVQPWPFSPARTANELRLTCEGKRLRRPSRNEDELRESLKAASPMIVRINLVRE